MKNDSPLVVVAILNFNRAKDTIETIHSVQNNDYPNFVILLADNASSDNSLQEITRNCKDILTVRSESNLGYTGGINFSISEALKLSPEYILVLNNDTIVESSFLSHLVNAIMPRPDTVAAGGLIIAEHDRRTIWFGNGKLSPFLGKAVHLHKGEDRSLFPFTEPIYTDFLTGCMVLYRADFLRGYKLEDERFFMYLDDIELSARIIRQNKKMIFEPKSIIYHKVLGEKESPFKLYYSVRNRLLLIKEMNKGFLRIFATLYFLFAISLKLCYWFFTNKVFFSAATCGLGDYFSGVFFEGRGIKLFLNTKLTDEH